MFDDPTAAHNIDYSTQHIDNRDYRDEALEEDTVAVLAPGDLLLVFGHFLSAAELIRVIMRVIMTVPGHYLLIIVAEVSNSYNQHQPRNFCTGCCNYNPARCCLVPGAVLPTACLLSGHTQLITLL